MTTRVECGGVEDLAGPASDDHSPASRVLYCPGVEQGPRWQPGERLQHLFENRCDAMRETGRGDHLAVAAADLVLTYGELDARANRLARHLLARGARPGDRIALLFDQAVHSYVGMLAVLKINAAYVPLDVGFPPDRVSYILQDADVRMVLSLSHLQGRLVDVPPMLVLVDEVQTLLAADSGRRLTREETGDPVDEPVSYTHLTCLLYTSPSPRDRS